MFSLRIFGKLNCGIAISVTLFFWLLTALNHAAESHLSYISPPHQQQLLEYAKQAERLLKNHPKEQLEYWKSQLILKENTYVNVVSIQVSDTIETHWNQMPEGVIYLGRPITKPIHLDQPINPLMDIPLDIENYHLLIRLPQRMRPGLFWDEIYLLGSILLTIMFAVILSYLLYRYIVTPLRQLQAATQRYGQGDFEHKLFPEVAKRNDELSELTASFDEMGHRLDAANKRQRQLIQDISHELRTPLTRIQLSLEGHEPESIIKRVTTEVSGMQHLVEGILTLASLDNDTSTHNEDSVDVAALIEIIVEDARFEFPHHTIQFHPQQRPVISHTNHLSLSQSFENVIRNACKYSKEGTTVFIKLWQEQDICCVDIEDQGPGVDTELLQAIFDPFVRADNSRNQHGYGIGLALCKRQINACGGNIHADHSTHGGLKVSIRLPLNNPP